MTQATREIGTAPAHVVLHAKMSNDDFVDLCAANPDLRIERTAEGDLIIMPPTGSETSRRSFGLTGQLAAWVARDGRGVGFDSNGGFTLPNGATRSPDASWVLKPRWQALPQIQRERFAPLCPDFVVELRSPADRLEDLQAKMEEYMENGASLGWLIDPIERRVHVDRHGARVECLSEVASVSGDPELPGFVLDLSAIW